MFELAEEGKRLMDDLEMTYRIGNLYDLYRIVTLPAGFKNTYEMNDGIIDYSKIIKGN